MRRIQQLVLFAMLPILFWSIPAEAQVTTATLYGLVRDSSGAIVPGASVLVTNEGTGVAREAMSDAGGEFVVTALSNGTYSVKIDLQGFKTRLQKDLTLGSGQTVRQTFTLELGNMAETVIVQGEAPLIETASSSQVDSLGSQEVRELPISRRNIANLLSLAPGVNGSGGNLQMNGVAAGGTGLTVDGTEANSNPEARSMSQYGGQNQISVMSIDAIQEVQIIKGVMPAEYGGVVGGQVNMISRSGTNNYRGSTFYNLQNQIFNARSFFSTSPKPTVNFNQYGGTLGGPVLRNKAFFFTTYEGYHETAGLNLSGSVPYPQTRDRLLAALPFPETKIVLDTLPQATEAIVSSAGVVNADIGRYRGTATRKRSENHVVAKSDAALFNGGSLAVTYTRMRPWTLEPRFNVNGSNDRVFPNEQDRIASQFAMTRGLWVSESRFGWNRTYLKRLDAFFDVKDPDTSSEIMPWGRRVGLINISGLFSTPSAEVYDLSGGAWTFDQKFSRAIDRHLIKAGFRWVRQTGDKMSPQNPNFAYQNLADALANVAQSITVSFGAGGRYHSNLDEFGGFIQDDWRLGRNLVLNLGLRYDFYQTIRINPTTTVPAEIVNLAPASDLRLLDFGPQIDPQQPYEPDHSNIGPRLGFAWTVPHVSDTVVRGGSGVLFSPHLPANVRQSVADPLVGFRQIYTRTEVAARGLKWPYYNDEFRDTVLTTSAGRKTIFSIFDTTLPAPYSIQSMVSVERGFGRSLALEVGYLRTNGRSMPLQRQFALAFDRQTGTRPNPALGSPGGYYVSSEQTLDYNALQMSFRKRFSRRYSYDVNYTWSKGEATQGGDIAAYYIASIGNTQDFWDPEFDRGPTDNDVRHRMNGTFIYELPGVNGDKGLLNGIVGGWQLSGILSARSGSALTITQPSGIGGSRPDTVAGVNPVVENWQDTCTALGCNYLNPAAFVLVPISTVTNATLRPGNAKVGAVRGPSSWGLNATLAKNFPVGAGRKLQVRIDAFSALNAKSWGSPTTNINSAEFGRITGAGGSRSMQIGSRFTF